MHLSTLPEWLAWIDTVHTMEIELGLDRVKQVAERLHLLTPSCPVIIVGGTNGKGSTVSGLESIYRASGYRTGAFTSPILFKHNEQVRINGEMATDEAFCEAFSQIEAARQATPLTPFEFCTLAAFWIFRHTVLDVLILEVGLGGRLDAVNILDADVAVVTSIGIDHVNWLGNTREQIGKEKAGIFRHGRPAVCGDFNPPITLTETASNLSAPWYNQGREFHFTVSEQTWSWQDATVQYDHLPLNQLATQNMAIVLEVITLLQNRLPVSYDAIVSGLKQVRLVGRLQVVEGPVTTIYDVSHNPDAVKWLSNKLQALPCSGKTIAIFSMLTDKDIVESLRAIQSSIDEWYVAPVQNKRAASRETLEAAFATVGINQVKFFSTLADASQAAQAAAQPGDRIAVFGSFHTLAEVGRG